MIRISRDLAVFSIVHFLVQIFVCASAWACPGDMAWQMLVYKNDEMTGRPACRVRPGFRAVFPDFGFQCSLSTIKEKLAHGKLPAQEGLKLRCSKDGIFFEDRAEYIASEPAINQPIILRLGHQRGSSKVKPYIVFVGCAKNAEDSQTPLCPAS